MTIKRLATALSVLKHQGPRGVAKVSLERAGMWWRHGETFEIGKLVGRATPVARLDGCRFDLTPPALGDHVRYQLLAGTHERPERTLLKKHLNRDLPLVELGASIGVVSCIANRRLACPERHVVVEASPLLVPILRQNRDRNGCRFSVLNRAVAYTNGAAAFRLDENPLASCIERDATATLTVPATTLREVLDTFGFERCTLVCDIEGTEVDLVEHEARTLAERVELLIVELHHRIVGDAAAGRLLDTLHAHGFHIVERIWDSLALRHGRG